MVQQGHTVLVERGVGVVTGYPDADYEQAGAKLIDDHEALFDEGDLVVKVKEPLPEEYSLMRPGRCCSPTFTSPPAANSPRPSAVPPSPRRPMRRSRSTAACRFSKQPKAVQRTALHDAVATINVPLLCLSHPAKRIDRPLPPLPPVINSPDAKGRDCGHPQGDRGVP